MLKIVGQFQWFFASLPVRVPRTFYGVISGPLERKPQEQSGDYKTNPVLSGACHNERVSIH